MLKIFFLVVIVFFTTQEYEINEKNNLIKIFFENGFNYGHARIIERSFKKNLKFIVLEEQLYIKSEESMQNFNEYILDIKNSRDPKICSTGRSFFCDFSRFLKTMFYLRNIEIIFPFGDGKGFNYESSHEERLRFLEERFLNKEENKSDNKIEEQIKLINTEIQKLKNDLNVMFLLISNLTNHKN